MLVVWDVITEGNPRFPSLSLHHATCVRGMSGMRFRPHLLDQQADPTHLLQARPVPSPPSESIPESTLNTVLHLQGKLMLFFLGL